MCSTLFGAAARCVAKVLIAITCVWKRQRVAYTWIHLSTWCVYVDRCGCRLLVYGQPHQMWWAHEACHRQQQQQRQPAPAMETQLVAPGNGNGISIAIAIETHSSAHWGVRERPISRRRWKKQQAIMPSWWLVSGQIAWLCNCSRGYNKSN